MPPVPAYKAFHWNPLCGSSFKSSILLATIMTDMYSYTVVPEDSQFGSLSPVTRERVANSLWAITLLLLLAGFHDNIFWERLVTFSVMHARRFLYLVGGSPLVFPAQLRIAYAVWVALGTYIPVLWLMMPITACGLPALLFFGYCPLARMLYLLPWNRQHGLDASTLWRLVVEPPGPGRFQLSQPKATSK